MNSIYDILNQEESISSFTSSIGGYLPKFYLTIAPGADAAHKGQILAFIELNNNFTSKEAYAYYLDSKLNSIIIGGNIDVNLPALTAPTADIEIILYSEDKSSLYSYADTLSSKIINLESIEKVDNNIPKASYQYELLINDDLSTFLGLTKYDIQKQVNMALTGIKTSTLIVDNVEYDIYLKSNISSITDIENFKIKSSFTGNKILLKQVAEMGLKAETPIIYRYDRIPSVTIKAKIAEGYSVQSSQKYIEELVNNTLNQDIIQVSYKGEKDTINKYLGGIAEAALYALAAIYVILLIQFKSSRQALIILMTVPLSIIGSIAGLYLFKQPFSFTAGLGLASLIGIVVNNAILLLEYINSSIFEGNSIKYSCVSSLERRYRPIMLSTITTIMGLIPLAFSGSSFFVPMAVTLMSGLFISTFFTLIVIPTLFNSIFEKSNKYNS
jgi:multidrug efflux pump subunit AcrB